MGFETLSRPRPIFNERPRMPIVPIERCRPVAAAVEPKPAEKPKPKFTIIAEPEPRYTAEELLARFKEVYLIDKTQIDRDNVSALAVIRTVARRHNLRVETILGEGRSKPVIAARWDAIASVRREFPGWSIVRIARTFNRDHSSIISVLKKTVVRK